MGETRMATEEWVRTLQEDLDKMRELVVSKQRQVNERYAANYNAGKKPLEFLPGDWVLLSVKSHAPVEEGVD